MPAASASGAVPRCSQPRSLGLTSARVSPTLSLRPPGSRPPRWRARAAGSCTELSRGLAHARDVWRVEQVTRCRDGPGGYHRCGGRLEARRCGGCSTRPTRRGCCAACRTTCPSTSGVMLDGNRRWAKAVGARHRPRPPRRRRQHRAAARLVRRGRHRGGHPVAALHRQPQPARGRARAAAGDHRGRRRLPRRAAALAAAPGGRARPAARRPPPSGSRRPRRPPATSTGCWSTSPSATAGAARSPTRSARCCTSTPRCGTTLEELAADHRRRAHRRPPLHQGPARPRPGDPHLRRAAARRVPAVAERAARSSTSARPTGPTSAASTSCARSGPTPCASAASAPERDVRSGARHPVHPAVTPRSGVSRPGGRGGGVLSRQRRVGKPAASGGPVRDTHDHSARRQAPPGVPGRPALRRSASSRSEQQSD